MLMLGALLDSAMLFTVGFGATADTTACELLPSELAVIVTLPPLIAETSPLELIPTMFASDDTYATARLVTTLPCSSLTVTDDCTVWPTLIDDGATTSSSEPTGAGPDVDATVLSDALPDRPPDVAVIVTSPAFSAVT